jgi:excisionase family DNA binding protein
MAPMKCPSPDDRTDQFADSLSLTHLAHRWHLHRRDVRRLLQSGALPFVQIRNQLRVPRSAAALYERQLHIDS